MEVLSSLPLSAAGGARWRWQAAPGQEALLAELQSQGVRGWLAEAQIVKHGPLRTVFRVVRPTGTFFAKLARPGRRWRRWLDRLRGDAATREARLAVQLRARGIATIEPLVWGQDEATGDCLLITAAWEPSAPLDQYALDHRLAWAQTPEAPPARALARGLGQWLAKLHRAGVEHGDLHAGNLLVRADSSRPQFLLIDLTAVRLRSRLGQARSMRNVAMFASGLIDLVPWSLRRRFWRHYLQQREEVFSAADPQQRRAWGAALLQRIAAHRQCIFRRRDRRCLASNRDFRIVQDLQGRAHALSNVDPPLLSALLDDPDGPLRTFRHHPVKLSHTALSVVARWRIDGESHAVLYKRCRVAGWLKRLVAPLRECRARRSWRLGHALLLRGVPTPRPVLCCWSRSAPRRDDSYLAVDWIEGSLNLHLYLWQLASMPDAERRQRTRSAARAVGKLLAQMQAAGVAHRDLKAANVLLVERPAGAEALVVDLDGVSLRRTLPWTERLRNVGRLAAGADAHPGLTRTDRLRVLRSWLTHLAAAEWSAPQAWKPLWRALAAEVAQQRARAQRSGKKLL